MNACCVYLQVLSSDFHALLPKLMLKLDPQSQLISWISARVNVPPRPPKSPVLQRPIPPPPTIASSCALPVRLGTFLTEKASHVTLRRRRVQEM
jgi:hypothetical protein